MPPRNKNEQVISPSRCGKDVLCEQVMAMFAVFEHSSDGIFIIDVNWIESGDISKGSISVKSLDFHLHTANLAARKMLSIYRDQQNVPLQECFSSDTFLTIRVNLIHCIQTRQAITYEAYFKVEHGCYMLRTTLTPAFAPDGNISKIIGFCQDITEHKRLEAEIRLLQNITLAIANAPDFHATLGMAIAQVCQATGWDYGEAWVPSPKDNLLKCSPAWYGSGLEDQSGANLNSELAADLAQEIFRQAIASEQYELNSSICCATLPPKFLLAKFRTWSESLTFSSNMGIPGRVWFCKQPEWHQDVSQEPDESFFRAKIAKKIGLKSALGIPIIANEQVLAVLVFFMFASRTEDQHIIELVLTVAHQLGEVIGRKQAELALGESQRKLKSLVDSLPGIVFSCTHDSEWSIIYLSEGCLHLTGYTSKELVGKNKLISYHEITHPEDLPKILQAIDLAIANQQPYIVEYRIFTKIGQEKWLWEKGSGIFDHTGKVLGLEGFITDITERKQAEESLKIQARVLEKMVEGVTVSDENGVICFTNLAFEQMFGYEKDELKGQPISILAAEPPEENAKIIAKIIKKLNQQGAWIGELNNQKKDGTLLTTYAHISVLEISGNNYWIWVQEDITERKKSEEALRQAEAKYRSIFENAVEGIFQTTTDGNYLIANPMLARIYGYDSPSELISTVRDIEQQLYVDPNRRIEFMKILQKNDAVWNFESQIYRKDRSIIWISENARAIRDEHNQLLGYEGTVEDITQRKEAENELFKRDILLQGIAEAMNYLLTDSNHKQAVMKALETLGKTAGVDRVYICETHPHHPTQEIATSMRFEWTRDLIEPTINQPSRQNQPYHNLGMTFVYETLSMGISVNGLTRDFPPLTRQFLEQYGILSILMVPILVNQKFWGYVGFDDCHHHRYWTKGEELILMAIAASIGGSLQRYQAEEMMRHQAFHDRLTNLPNRMLFDHRLPIALENAKTRGHKLAVCFLDLDRFKLINDSLGHAIGDQLLQHTATRLHHCLREGDTIARWGGDEFILLLPHVNTHEDAAKVAGRILESLQPAFYIEGNQLYITCSIGIALYPSDGTDAETLIKNADFALYRAKDNGRNNFQLYDQAMNSKASELLILENNLHPALEREEFLVYYQPQINVETGMITRMEALVRWQHPKLGLIAPDEFIPLAEDNGLILSIGEWVLKTACAQNKAWQQAKLGKVRVAVNLSARQFQQPNVVETIANILAHTGLEPHLLELEITETTAMRDVDFTRTVLRELRAMGVHLSMDDFGIGYASLNYLKKFPFHTLKIDRSFVRELEQSSEDAAIIRAIITLAQCLNLSVVAEGVETAAQRDLLLNLNCKEMQGFLFSKPLNTENATNFLIHRLNQLEITGLKLS